ncbi:Malate dehydrogenase [Operophtera brumata]|uniref:Malate dehydrogenase, mitochondrial n=1 Tax=Operophtera brumata TaxID=104452 RepID=A0A0L7LRW3_OPEBR|nr:Malate dehydrogenase [Operophtera brumata]
MTNIITRRISVPLLSNQSWSSMNYVAHKNVQFSVIGAASKIGSNLSLLLKQNQKVRHLKLYDEDTRINGVGIELTHVPGGPFITAYDSDKLGAAIQFSDIIVMVSRTPRKPGTTREQMLSSNTSVILQLCKALANNNPEAFLAISTNPINSIIPFASAMLHKYHCYNPYKMFGITHIDTARSRAFAGDALNVNPRDLEVPVIGGHSDKTIVPLFSNLTPSYYQVDACQADMLTRLVRKAGTEVLINKQGTESATLAMAWSIHEFVDGLINAICGSEVVLNCYTANPHYGTKFFSGPTNIGCYGIKQTCGNFKMSAYESYMLNNAISAINCDVAIGEEYVRYIEGPVKR